MPSILPKNTTPPRQGQYVLKNPPSTTPQAPISFGQLNSRLGSNASQGKHPNTAYQQYGTKPNNDAGPYSTIVAESESPPKYDTSSRMDFEKIINGEYSQMSAMKHLIGDNDDTS